MNDQTHFKNFQYNKGSGTDFLGFDNGLRSLNGGINATLRPMNNGYDLLVPHQANLRIISATAKKLGMSMDNVVVTLDRHGNTSAASVPCALDEAVRDGRIKPGQLVLLEAFGGGFTWGSALVRF